MQVPDVVSGRIAAFSVWPWFVQSLHSVEFTLSRGEADQGLLCRALHTVPISKVSLVNA